MCVCPGSSLCQQQCSHWCTTKDCCLASATARACWLESLRPTLPALWTAVTVMHKLYVCVCGHALPIEWKTTQYSPYSPSPGNGSLFACCNPTKLRGHPATFFILHALGGAILFTTDGIMVRLSANTSHVCTQTINLGWGMGTSLLCHYNQKLWQ